MGNSEKNGVCLGDADVLQAGKKNQNFRCHQNRTQDLHVSVDGYKGAAKPVYSVAVSHNPPQRESDKKNVAHHHNLP